MQPSRTRSCKANTKPACVFCVSTSHTSRCYFVADLNKPNFVGALSERLHDSVDAIPWQSKNHIDAPIVNGVVQHVRRRRFHARVLLHCWTSGAGICHVNSCLL